jgi:LacI family transcriptional regulator
MRAKARESPRLVHLAALKTIAYAQKRFNRQPMHEAADHGHTRQVPCRGYDHAIDEVRECHVPLVMADRVDETFPAHTVTTDSHGASVSGTEHLIALGHRRIVFLVNMLDLVNSRERADGYIDAMRRAGLDDHIRVIECGMTAAEIHASTLDVPSGGAGRPTALFAGGNVTTLGALRAIRAADLRLPDDISLLSFDDAPWMSVLRPYLSSIRQPVEAIGRAIWQLMLKLLNGERGSGAGGRTGYPTCIFVVAARHHRSIITKHNVASRNAR